MKGTNEKTFTLLFYSFRIPKEWPELLNALSTPQSIWQKSAIGINEQFLFSHVEDYFNFNANLQLADVAQIDTSQCVFFELKESLKSTRAQFSFEKLFNLALQLQTKESTFPFRFYDGLKKGILSPKILIVPYAKIGVLSFCLEMDEADFNLQRLTDFNYACRLINRQSRSVSGIQFRGENTNPKIESIFSALQGQATTNNPKTTAFSFAQLVDFLLADLYPLDIEPLTPKRFHIFTYVQTSQNLSPTEISQYLFYLSRIYNANYQSAFEAPRDNPEIIQTFKNIYLSVSIEGGCILVNETTSSNPAFFDNYLDNVVKTRYLWIYFLAFQQRIALINTAYTLSNILKVNNYSVDHIAHSIEHLTKIQLSSMFTEISYIKMHNEFYALCRKSFKIPELMAELRDELFDLNTILQQQYEQQRRQQDIEEEAARRRTEDRQVKFEARLNLIVFSFGLLTFISVWKDFTDMVSDGFKTNEIKALINLGALIIAVTLLVFGINFIFKRK